MSGKFWDGFSWHDGAYLHKFDHYKNFDAQFRPSRDLCMAMDCSLILMIEDWSIKSKTGHPLVFSVRWCVRVGKVDNRWKEETIADGELNLKLVGDALAVAEKMVMSKMIETALEPKNMTPIKHILCYSFMAVFRVLGRCRMQQDW